MKTKLKTYLSTIKRYFYNKYDMQTNRKVLWLDVPSACKTKEEKEHIIFEAIERLGQQIKIENNE